MLIALGAVLSGMIASRIFYTGANLLQFKVESFGTVVVMVCSCSDRCIVFYSELRRTGEGNGGVRHAGQAYTREFNQKWIRGPRPADEPLLGSADIQSLADLRNGFEVVQGIRWCRST